MVDFDWQIEAENGSQRVEEDPTAVAQRQRQARRWRIIAAVLLLVLIGGGIAAAVRLRYVNQQRRIALEETVAAETLALRVGDRQAFLSAQAEIAWWQDYQSKVFDRYQTEDAEDLTEATFDYFVQGSEAEVYLINPFLGIWFYHHDGQHWRQVPPPDDLWGDPVTETTEYLVLRYRELDKDNAAILRRVLHIRIRRLCDLGLCTDDHFPIVIDIVPDTAVDEPVFFQSADEHGVRVPSPNRGVMYSGAYYAFYEDRACDGACSSAVRQIVVDNWLSIAVTNTHPWSSMGWMEVELDRWLANKFDVDAPRSDVIDGLEAVVGPDFVGQLLSGMQSAPPADVLEALLDEAFADERVMADPETMLAAYLRAELALYEVSSQQTELSIGDPVRQSGGGSFFRPTLAEADPASIEVVHIDENEDTLLVTVAYRNLLAAQDEPVRYRVELFRLVDGRWYHTPPSADDWGTGTTQSGEGVVVRYRELDRLYGEGVFAAVTDARQDIMADFGLPNTTVFDVTISPAEQEVLTAFVPPSVSQSDAVVVIVSSPYNGNLRPDLPGQTLNGQLEVEVLNELLRRLIRRQTGAADLNAVQEALIRYDLERLGYEEELRPLDEVPDNASPNDDSCVDGFSLQALWDYGEACDGQRRLNRQGASVLLELLVSRYGAEITPDLHQHLDAPDLDSWLAESEGISLSDLDAEWRVRLETQYGGSGTVE